MGNFRRFKNWFNWLLRERDAVVYDGENASSQSLISSLDGEYSDSIYDKRVDVKVNCGKARKNINN